MNKKVLTLCAGFLLAGGMSAFAESFPIGSSMVTGADFKDGGSYYLVNTINGDNYAYGFFYPIVCSLTALMEFEDGRLKWKINPLTINFEDEKVINNFAFYIDQVKQVLYDPQ